MKAPETEIFKGKFDTIIFFTPNKFQDKLFSEIYTNSVSCF